MIAQRASRPEKNPKTPTPVLRMRLAIMGILLVLLLIVYKLFHWQIVRGPTLAAEAEAQYLRTKTASGSRGIIYSAEGFPLVLNETAYRLVGYPELVDIDPMLIATQITPVLLPTIEGFDTASNSAETLQKIQTFQQTISTKLDSDKKWVSLIPHISQETKVNLESLDIKGIGFEPFEKRTYPEASMAAQVLGFVGKTNDGADIGYFGIEGKLEDVLRGQSSKTTIMADAHGYSLLTTEKTPPLGQKLQGQDVYLTIRRDIQFLVEQKLQTAIKKYGAQKGEVIIMEPGTGHIIAMASFPSYTPEKFFSADPQLYRNASIADLYEPGSTFKVFTIAAGIDAGVITPHTPCPVCAEARTYDKYTIKNWNDVYNPNISMQDALAKSDNTAMIFVAERLGQTKLLQYLKNFGIGEKTYISLQGDRDTPFKEKLYPVELATTAFGQGISANSLQLTRAVGAIANNGILVHPTIVQGVMNTETQQIEPLPKEPDREVIKPSTAKTVAEMMNYAAKSGEAQWVTKKDGTVAGKTGTSQIPMKGGYKKDATIATYVGFKPYDKPKYVMFVKLVEPKSSIWAAETAAPLWYELSQSVDELL